ncbi:hypothetical protein STEG23_027798, partial [Scotinomys teguina]
MQRVPQFLSVGTPEGKELQADVPNGQLDSVHCKHNAQAPEMLRYVLPRMSHYKPHESTVSYFSGEKLKSPGQVRYKVILDYYIHLKGLLTGLFCVLIFAVVDISE